MEKEAKIQAAIRAFQAKEYKSVRAAARAFSVPASTVHDRLAGRLSRLHAHEPAQILSNAEETTLRVKRVVEARGAGVSASSIG